jgi:hypothetical protein
MSETIQEMEGRWALAMAARYGDGHRLAGQRIVDVDAVEARKVFALGTQIQERKAAEASRPQINIEQLNWLNAAQGATKNGKRLYEPGSQYQRSVDAARKTVLDGGDIAGMRLPAGSEQGPVFAGATARQRQAAHEAGMPVFGPPSHVHTSINQQPTVSVSASRTVAL